MGNPVLGKCACPICSKAAEVREGVNGKAYIVCDWCVTHIRTLSGAGVEFIRKLIIVPAPAPQPAVPPAAPGPKAEPAAGSRSALDLISGG